MHRNFATVYFLTVVFRIVVFMSEHKNNTFFNNSRYFAAALGYYRESFIKVVLIFKI